MPLTNCIFQEIILSIYFLYTHSLFYYLIGLSLRKNDKFDCQKKYVKFQPLTFFPKDNVLHKIDLLICKIPPHLTPTEILMGKSQSKESV
jgi:hypothetical protein